MVTVVVSAWANKNTQSSIQAHSKERAHETRWSANFASAFDGMQGKACVPSPGYINNVLESALPEKKQKCLDMSGITWIS